MKLECYRPKNTTGKTYHYRLVLGKYNNQNLCGSTAYYGSNVTIFHPGMPLVNSKGLVLTPCKNCLKSVTMLAQQTNRFASEALPSLVKDIETTVYEYDMAETVFGHRLLQVLHNK